MFLKLMFLNNCGYALGVGDKEVTEPYSVYTVRRKASGRKRIKDVSSSSAMPRLRLDLISTPGYENSFSHV